MSKLLIDIKNISKKYNIGKANEVEVLKEINLQVYEGELVAIVGESGSGKSTLMNIIGALDKPTTGEYYFLNNNIAQLNDKELSYLRNKKIGFVFQSFCLLPRMNAIKNVALPMMYAKVGAKKRIKLAKELLTLVGLENRFYHKPNELSGGQNQRVAIARALANNPSVILADEPTGALDSKSGNMVMELFQRLNKERGITIILITHNKEIANGANRIIKIADGKITNDNINFDGTV